MTKTFVALLCLILTALPSTAGTLVWVELPGARAATVHRLVDEGFLPWLGNVSKRGDLHPIAAPSVAAVDSMRALFRRDPSTTVVDLGWRDQPAGGTLILGISDELRRAPAWEDPSGEPSAAMLDAWRGEARISEFHHVSGLDDRLRWEEVLEFASLTDRQTRALAEMPDIPGHPLWEMRRAYAVDRLFANAAIYYGRDRNPQRLFLHLGLVQAYEEMLLPWTDSELAKLESGGDAPELEKERATRRLFLRRLRSSAPRLYGRVDRVLQSIQAELGKDVFLVIDATGSEDPFIAIAGASPQMRARIAQVSSR
jgi:hypothetical protein